MPEVICKDCRGSGTMHKRSGGTLVLVKCDRCNGHGKIGKLLVVLQNGVRKVKFIRYNKWRES